MYSAWRPSVGKKPARRPDRYHRSNTVQLLAAFAPHTGHAVGVPSSCKTGEVVLTFLQETVLPHFGTDRKILYYLGQLQPHKRALNLWPAAPADIKFFWTPTNASWLNLIEPWLLVLEKTALYNTDLKTTQAIAENPRQGIDYLNEHPRPYRWTKQL